MVEGTMNSAQIDLVELNLHVAKSLQIRVNAHLICSMVFITDAPKTRLEGMNLVAGTETQICHNRQGKTTVPIIAILTLMYQHCHRF